MKLSFFNQKKTASIIGVLLIAISSASMASNDKYRFKIVNSDGNKESPVGQSVQLWADLLKEKSGGRMKARVFHQGELGSQGEVFDHMLKGNVDMILQLPQTSYDKRMGLMNLPYLFFTWEQAERGFGLQGWLTKAVDPIFTEMGVKHFGAYPFGFGGVATKSEYASNYEDAVNKGLKVRAIPGFPIPQTMQAMGYQSVPIDWNEVYTSIQTGVVDGDSGNIIYWDYQYFGDQIDYFVHTKHLFSFSSLMMNKETWDNMDEEDQAIVASAASEVIKKQFRDAKSEDDMWIAAAQKDGIKYIVPSEKEMKTWIQPVREKVWGMAEEEYGKEFLQTIRDNAPKI